MKCQYCGDEHTFAQKCSIPLPETQTPEGFEPKVMNGAVEYRANWQDKIARRLFPQRHCEMPKWFGKTYPADGLHVGITIEISFVDRVRILLTGRAIISSKTLTENLIGNHVTNSSVSVLPWKFLERE